MHSILVMLSVLFAFAAAAKQAVAAEVVPPQAKPGCADHCGSLTIPYPFGIGPGCYMTDDFSVSCNTSTEPPIATWAAHDFNFSSIPITSISLADGEMQVMLYIASDCYDSQGVNKRKSQFIMMPNTNFTVSHTRNKFNAVGCDTIAQFEGRRAGKTESLYTGCMPMCDNLNSLERSCSGLGCCKSDIPSGLSLFVVRLRSFNNHTYVQEFNPCSYAFVVEEGKFKFSPNTSFEELSNIKNLPMILNWEIGLGLCDEAEKKDDYACKANNSRCADRTISDVRSGYFCQCKSGYQGNPYLLDGCQDIDECKVSNPCTHGKCHNSPGSYSCLCDRGYISNGTNHQSCIHHTSGKHQPKKMLLLIVSLSTGGSLGLIFLVISAWWLDKVIKKRKTKRRKEKNFKQNGGLVLQQQLSSGDQANVEKIKLFNSRELEKATDYFSSDRILGHGGQGTVYKGMLTDGQIVAVKKSKIFNGGEVGQFINEIVILSQINHRNVVKLLGCCLETEVPLLVYEYLPNGTLSQYIHDQDEEFPLTWGKRLRVSAEVAGALSYLHSAASIPIYHRDIKCTNILLDAKYRAKIADFGTSRSVSVDQTHLTTLVHGTLGYLDPEYLQSNQFTEKSDVYSFGVVLAELLTGQKPVSIMRPHECRSLATHFLLSMKQNRLFDILDPQVMKDGSKEEIIAVANLAQRCLNLNGRKRPTMREVASELERVRLAAKDADHVQQNLVEEGDVGTHEIHTMDYCDVVSMSTTGPFTDGGTADSSFDVQPLLFYKTQ